MRNNEYLNEKVQYIRDIFVEEDEVLLKIKNDAKLLNREISINPEEGKLLQVLIKLGSYKKILEIGTFLGYSTIWMARASEDVKIFTIEKDKPIAEKANENFKCTNLDKRISLINDTAENVLPLLKEEFDMIFIDAEKNHYLQYLDWAEKYVRVGGLIVADNSLLSGAVYKKELPYRIRESTRESMKLFNKRLSNKDKYLSILLPAEDGITIAIKK